MSSEAGPRLHQSDWGCPTGRGFRRVGITADTVGPHLHVAFGILTVFKGWATRP